MFKLIGEADSSHQVLTAAVQTICHFTRCAMGQVWLPAGGVLVCSPSWCCSGYGFEKLHAASEAVNYELGEGLPGLAWAKRQPLLLEDIRDTGRFDRPSPPSGPASRAAWAGSPGSPRSSGRWSSGAGPTRPWPPPRSASRPSPRPRWTRSSPPTARGGC